MPRIRILPEILASQVAAGEVVERPASAVKELVENSLDAGAGEILVEIRRGGAALLRVIDNGSGMSRDDALMSLERHATSKLADSAGLASICTLGFRGEAVPSIASVSRFRLTTREPQAVAGTEISVEGGVMRDVREAGCAPGTTVEVKDLFYNVPARRKFLRAETTESAHVEHQLRMHALAASGVRFRFRKDEREVFDLPAGMSRLDRVRWMTGTELGRELISLPLTHGNGVSVEGFVLPAAHARKGRRHQCVFLNGRPVEDSAISRGLAEGFRGALGDGLHPAAWMWIEIEPSMVDVNVHPAKREIRLHRPHELREVIAESVREGLAKAEAARRPVYKQPIAPGPSVPANVVEDRPVLRSPVAEVRPVFPAKSAPREWPASLPVQRTFETIAPAVPSPVATPQPALAVPELEEKAPPFRYVGTLRDRFALLESEDGLVLLDPRAARERILYERWLHDADGRGVESQTLLVPVLLEPGPRECELAIRHRDEFAKAGIDIEDFGSGTLRIGSLPDFLKLADARAFLSGLLDELAGGQLPGSRVAFDHLAKLLSRRAALAEAPRPQEAMRLLEALFRCELPYCAPDGRPTLSEFSMRELERRFAGGKSGGF
ncbi:DNA mismatch repair endonuclease MutL [Luteolibacter flavescens]|uniref:DNA mismatch repair protein MutL n=1 Tax=Luteolibacter flavescens TaxID=1859460 RepID=A0ABT3FSQ8_9BACT|nr:DNA mismatch repair endonuclease MutL [Luteolibacter flavescens]MCW1886614.1 DNA mismatch repair endonuclease MutL [Luteolibacter flavescens]